METFVDHELGGAIAVARELSRHWKERTGLKQKPRIVFITNGSDGGANAWANLLRAAMEGLIRIRRDESEVDARLGGRRFPEWGNQIIRYDNSEAENLPFTVGHAARLLFKEQRIRQVNLYFPTSLAEASGARRATVGFTENLAGLHNGKVALITGGSAGIGASTKPYEREVSPATPVPCPGRNRQRRRGRPGNARDAADGVDAVARRQPGGGRAAV
jgi:malonyl-CoA reductase / 3-hydroxypropionate dehydrogenase (NADP+)